jgi:hypothetical protein
MRLILVPTVAQGPADSCASPIQLPAPSEAATSEVALLIFSERVVDLLDRILPSCFRSCIAEFFLRCQKINTRRAKKRKQPEPAGVVGSRPAPSSTWLTHGASARGAASHCSGSRQAEVCGWLDLVGCARQRHDDPLGDLLADRHSVT